MLKITSSLWSCCWKSTYNCLEGISHKLCLICFKQSYGFLVLALKWYWQVLLSFQSYLICLFLTCCSIYESHTHALVLNFWSSGHHLLYYPSCLSVFGKENEHCK